VTVEPGLPHSLCQGRHRWRDRDFLHAAALRQPGLQLLRRERSAQVVSLDEVAPLGTKLLHDFLVFDTFGNDAQAEIVCQVNGRMYDHRVIFIAVHVDHEGLVDLQFPHRQALEIRQ